MHTRHASQQGTATMIYRKVHLGSINLWWDEDEFLRTGDTPLALPHHVSPDGQELIAPWHEVGFACAERTGIWRFGRKIGEITDLAEGWVS